MECEVITGKIRYNYGLEKEKGDNVKIIHKGGKPIRLQDVSVAGQIL